MGVVLNYLGTSDRVTWQEMPGIAYIGQLRDIKPSLEVLQVDEKPSVIVDYRNGGGGDELRLVNAKERIYLGRGVDWLPGATPSLFAYFILQFYDHPQLIELALGTPLYYKAREAMWEAAGAEEKKAQLKVVQATPPPPASRSNGKLGRGGLRLRVGGGEE